jgi:hypothetical protein
MEVSVGHNAVQPKMRSTAITWQQVWALMAVGAAMPLCWAEIPVSCVLLCCCGRLLLCERVGATTWW